MYTLKTEHEVRRAGDVVGGDCCFECNDCCFSVKQRRGKEDYQSLH
jgi:streptolysin S family bacteriocin protoxin